jgi:hypothetical protein
MIDSFPQGFAKQRAAQGLPMSFIVLAIMAILVLVIVVFMLLGGLGQTQALDAQSVANNCNSECFLANQYTRTATSASLPKDSGFCSKNFTIKGVGVKYCYDIVSCTLVFKDGSTCTAQCDANKKIKC